MRVRVLAVGTRMPGWVGAACDDYLKRLRPWLRIELVELAPGPRSSASPARRAIDDEGRRLLGALREGERIVALDERGREYSTRELAAWLDARRAAAEDLAFVIGGPDGLAPPVRERATLEWSLSRLTLPHALARVVLIEQLYRAMSVLARHPYHRE